MGPDGLVYGGTTSYQAGRLFAFDPATRVITDITLPVTSTYWMEALTTAQGRIYAGIGNQLVAYDPGTRQAIRLGAPQPCAFHTLVAGPDGLIYAGCDDQLLAYNPQTAEVTLVGKTTVAEIRSLIVGSDGLPRDIRVGRSLSPEFDESAIDAVKKWKFAPATKDGKPVAVEINIEINFKR